MDNIRSVVVVSVVVILYSVQATAQIGETMRCVEKLLPCHPYIHSEIPPPPWSCTPMKEIAENDATCLCTALNHPDMLSFINLTKENALTLLNSCGVNHAALLCDNSPSSSSSMGSIISGSSSTSTMENAILAISFLGFSFVSVFL